MRETNDEILGRAARLRESADRLEQKALLARGRQDFALGVRFEAANLRKLAEHAARAAAVPNRN
jgi:hypothetical protein